MLVINVRTNKAHTQRLKFKHLFAEKKVFLRSAKRIKENNKYVDK